MAFIIRRRPHADRGCICRPADGTAAPAGHRLRGPVAAPRINFGWYRTCLLEPCPVVNVAGRMPQALPYGSAFESGVESTMMRSRKSQKMPTWGSGVMGLFTVSLTLLFNVSLGVVFEVCMDKAFIREVFRHDIVSRIVHRSACDAAADDLERLS